MENRTVWVIFLHTEQLLRITGDVVLKPFKLNVLFLLYGGIDIFQGKTNPAVLLRASNDSNMTCIQTFMNWFSSNLA